MARALEVAREGMRSGQGGPFGCVVVRDGAIISVGCNRVLATNDPTAHAEVVAIRAACERLGSFQLPGCDIYTICEPCPMCLGAIYWARPQRVIYANTRQQAAAIEFDDNDIYQEIGTAPEARRIPFHHAPFDPAEGLFREWIRWEGRHPY